MRDFSNIPLSEMMSKAAAFRGEIVTEEDPIVDRIRAAAHHLAWGVSEEDVAAHLMLQGATSEEAFLAVKAAKVLE